MSRKLLGDFSSGQALIRWLAAHRARVDQVDWDRARHDVLPFLERERDLQLVTEDALLGLLKGG